MTESFDTQEAIVTRARKKIEDIANGRKKREDRINRRKDDNAIKAYVNAGPRWG